MPVPNDTTVPAPIPADLPIPAVDQPYLAALGPLARAHNQRGLLLRHAATHGRFSINAPELDEMRQISEAYAILAAPSLEEGAGVEAVLSAEVQERAAQFSAALRGGAAAIRSAPPHRIDLGAIATNAETAADWIDALADRAGRGGQRA